MKKLIVHDLRLLSRREKAATAVTFHPKATVIRGENDTGKSSLLKSLYWCLGADSAKVNDNWKALDICGALHFSVDNQHFTIVRHANQFGLFDIGGNLMSSFKSVTKELGPYFSELVDFGLLLTPRDGEPHVPPPAFFLLPFYIDQDLGWHGTWCSFANLNQFRDWKRDVAEYHIGLYDNRYYGLKTKLASVKDELEEQRRQEASLARIIQQLRSRLGLAPVDLDFARFQKEIDELVKAASQLADEEQRYRRKISELSNQHVFLSNLSITAQRVLAELDADWEFAESQPHEIACPTCGATYESSLLERFGLVFDQDYCRNVITDAHAKVSTIAQRLAIQRERMADVNSRHTHIWRMLETKREALTLHDVIKGEAHGQAIGALQAEIDSMRALVSDTERRIDGTKRELATYKDAKRTASYKDYMNQLLRAYSVELNVPVVGPLRSFAANINQTGSDLPRAVLAYSYAILQMIWRSAQSAVAPIVIDSPKQQDQDEANWQRILHFIKAHQPEGSQLILGLVDPRGVDYGGIELVLTEERRLLDPGRYETTGRDLEDLLVKMSK